MLAHIGVQYKSGLHNQNSIIYVQVYVYVIFTFMFFIYFFFIVQLSCAMPHVLLKYRFTLRISQR